MIAQVNEKIIDYTQCKNAADLTQTCAQKLNASRHQGVAYPSCTCTIDFTLDEDFHVSR